MTAVPFPTRSAGPLKGLAALEEDDRRVVELVQGAGLECNLAVLTQEERMSPAVYAR